MDTMFHPHSILIQPEMQQMIRCKFLCNSVTKSKGAGPDGFVYSASFNVVYSGSPENDSFFAATPGGSLTLQTFKSDTFEPGQMYYLDLTPAS